MDLNMVIILLHDNTQPHIFRMTLLKLTELEYETLPHLPYSSDLLLINYLFFLAVVYFLNQKTFCSKEEVEMAFWDFLTGKKNL